MNHNERILERLFERNVRLRGTRTQRRYQNKQLLTQLFSSGIEISAAIDALQKFIDSSL
jgi:hypothetical protein